MPLFQSPPSHLVLALVSAAAFAPTLLACHRDTGSAQLTSGATSASADATMQAPIPDADIARAIHRHLQEDTALRSEHVQVSVAQGICTLSGSVGNLLAKERALRVAETLKGVRSVIDQIGVTPIARTDEQLRADVTHELQQDVATREHVIGVVAKDGTVTLTGAAGSWPEKTLFAQVAKTVKGVKGIDNQVVIHYEIVPSEAEISADVKHRLANDVSLDGEVIGVTVTGHTVHLTGVVGSVAEKSRARSDGWMVGVDSVDDSSVVVDWRARDDERYVVDHALRSDDEVGKAVRDAFRFDPRLRTLEPHVTVTNGAVVLSGAVDSSQARRAAKLDATDTVGVWEVRDRMVMQAIAKPTDADVERGVKRALSRDLLLPNSAGIHVSSAKGKVVLAGEITSGFERFDALEDATSVAGVAEIVDELKIKRSPPDIKSDIDNRLYWDATVQRDRVAVVVAPDGVATLRGTLDSWIEIKAALNDAVLGGAPRVVNALELKRRSAK